MGESRAEGSFVYFHGCFDAKDVIIEMLFLSYNKS